MSRWIQISLTLDGEGAEAVADTLRRYVHQGVSIEQPLPGEAWSDEPLPQGPLIVRGYIPADESAPAAQRQIEEALYYLKKLYPLIPAPEFQVVEEEEWAEAWKKHYHPIRIGQRILIKPAWVEVEIRPEDIVIEMDPGMAFGTGTHPTTQLCLQAVERFAGPETSLLDLGTGSGVLAIAAARLGTPRVFACDIDPLAVRVAQENVRRNGVQDRVSVAQGSLAELLAEGRCFDWAVANLTARVITELAGQGLERVIQPGGRFVFSGLIDTQAGEVADVLEAVGLPVVERESMSDWVMLIAERLT
jgi:ribosomal protein L11 methyltransferase